MACRHFARQTQGFHRDIILGGSTLNLRHLLFASPCRTTRVTALPLRGETRNGSPWITTASRVSLKAAVESNRAEFGVNSKDEIKRLVELLLTTDDLRAVQSLTVEVQRAMYLHIEELQRRLMVPRIEGPNDGSVVEIDGSNPSSGLSLPKPGERP